MKRKIISLKNHHGETTTSQHDHKVLKIMQNVWKKHNPWTYSMLCIEKLWFTTYPILIFCCLGLSGQIFIRFMAIPLEPKFPSQNRPQHAGQMHWSTVLIMVIYVTATSLCGIFVTLPPFGACLIICLTKYKGILIHYLWNYFHFTPIYSTVYYTWVSGLKKTKYFTWRMWSIMKYNF